MEYPLAVLLCVCLAGQALCLPQWADSDTASLPHTASDQSSSRSEEPMPPRKEVSSTWKEVVPSREGVSSRKEEVVKDLTTLESQVLKRSPAQDDTMKQSDMANPVLLQDSTLNMEVKKELSEEKVKQRLDQSGAPVNLRFPEGTTRQEMADTGDNTRAKKSTSEMQYPLGNNPHTTTVCIQVRSDHMPRVVCGDPLSESKSEADPSTIPPTKARFAYRTPNDYYPHTYEQRPLSMPYISSSDQAGYYRASSQDISSQSSQAKQGQSSPLMLVQKQSSTLDQRQGLMIPKAAQRGPQPVSMYQLRRSEEESISPKIGDSPIPQNGPGGPGSNPVRITIPSPSPVLVHKQYYPAPSYHQGYNLINPSVASPLRLNCAPDGGFLPYLRSGPPAPYIEERLIVNPMAARMVDVPQYIDEQQAFYMDRQAAPDSMLGSPYNPDGLSGTLFIDEDGQTYMISNNQARSAGSDQMMWDQNQYLGAEAKEDILMKAQKQDEELQRSKEKIEEVQKQLRSLQAKAAEGDGKKDPKKDPSEDKDINIGEKKNDQPKSSKRQAYRNP